MMKENSLSCAIRLTVASGLLAAGAAPAFAQTETTLQRVEITGSSLRRTANETALPVTVLSRADIDKSGVQTTEELLGQINSVSSAGGQVNGGQSGLTTYGKSAVSLRGLGSDKTLVLVNGRRMANFAGGASSGADVNVNAIPLSAIERVEVLQDGASGVYGSDAIAGVVNFILRKDFKGVEISGLHGRPTRSGGGARQNKLGLVAGFGDYDVDRFSVVLSGAVEREGNLLGAQRDFANSDTRLPYFEGGATETGRIEGTWDFPGMATEFDAGANARSLTNPYGVSGTGYGNPMAAQGKCAEIGMIARSGKGYSAGAPDDTQSTPNCTFDTGPFVSLVPNRKFKGGTTLLRFKLNDQNELYFSGLYSKNEFVNPIQPAPLRQAFYAGNTLFAGSGVEPALLIYPSNPNYQIAANYLNSVGLGAMVGHPLAISQRTFLLGQRTTKDIAKQHQLVLGGKGSVGGLNYDVAYIHNISKTEGNVIDGFASIFGLSKVLNDPAVHWNPWAPLGQQSPQVRRPDHRSQVQERRHRRQSGRHRDDPARRRRGARCRPAGTRRIVRPDPGTGDPDRRRDRPGRRHHRSACQAFGLGRIRRNRGADRQGPERQPGGAPRQLQRLRQDHQLQG
jgi:iron complex outermembrane receptor protein